jgi:hypothetical protein
MQNENRNNRMMMANNMNAAQYQNMMRAMPNGVQPNDLKRAAAMNRNPYVESIEFTVHSH